MRAYDKKLAEKSDVTDLSKLEARILQLEDRLSKHEQEVGVKFHFMDDKVQDSLTAGVSTQNMKVEDEEKIKKLFSWKSIRNRLLRMIRNVVNVILSYTEHPKKEGKGIRSQSISDETFVTDLLDCSSTLK